MCWLKRKKCLQIRSTVYIKIATADTQQGTENIYIYICHISFYHHLCWQQLLIPKQGLPTYLRTNVCFIIVSHLSPDFSPYPTNQLNLTYFCYITMKLCSSVYGLWGEQNVHRTCICDYNSLLEIHSCAIWGSYLANVETEYIFSPRTAALCETRFARHTGLESYAGGSISFWLVLPVWARRSAVPNPLCWGLGVRIRALPRKKLLLRNLQSQRLPWRRPRPTQNYSAIKEQE
jgi:hypothetical protein